MTAERLYLFDTTLRDGQQSQGVDFSVDDKIRIAEALDSIGIDYVEGGWPGANPTDSAFFAAAPKLRHATLTAFVSPMVAARMLGLSPEQMQHAIGISAARHCTLGAVTAGKLTMSTNAQFPPYESDADDGKGYEGTGFEGIDIETRAERTAIAAQQDHARILRQQRRQSLAHLHDHRADQCIAPRRTRENQFAPAVMLDRVCKLFLRHSLRPLPSSRI